MTATPYIAEIAALVGDPARSSMLTMLLGGQALTATELALAAGVAPSTASGHLSRLTEGRLLAVLVQGRHRYYRLASPAVARMLEGLAAVAVDGPPRHRPRSMRDDALAAARTCYDHLAGRLGVSIADALTEHGHVVLEEDGGLVTDSGRAFLADLGVDLDRKPRGKRAFCRPCLDWSERRWHIGGSVGAALAARCMALGWVARRADSRAVTVTEPGRAGLHQALGLRL